MESCSLIYATNDNDYSLKCLRQQNFSNFYFFKQFTFFASLHCYCHDQFDSLTSLWTFSGNRDAIFLCCQNAALIFLWH